MEKANTFETKPNTFERKANTFATEVNTFVAEVNTLRTNSNTFMAKGNTFMRKANTFATEPNTFAVKGNGCAFNPNVFVIKKSPFPVYLGKTNTMRPLLFLLLLALPILSLAQQNCWQQYEPNAQYPFGQKHPEAPEQLNDFAPMTGICDCRSLRRNPDGSWADTTNMVWQFKYILNGTAIQDETWRDNFYATSIRQYHPDSAQWAVTYFSFPGISTKPTTWLGKKEGQDIVLKVPQKSPNGLDGINRLTFTNISPQGFDWKGEWINEEKGIVYPFWLIWCEKR